MVIISGRVLKKARSERQYRNKMEFSFGDEYKDGPLALGMHKRGSFHDIVNVYRMSRLWMRISDEL